MLAVDTWLAANSRPDAVVISALDPLVYLGSGRKSIRAFYVDPLPIFYGIPSSIDADAEFSRVMRTYKPRYIVQLQPDFFESRFVWKSTEQALRDGSIQLAFASAQFAIYRVINPDFGFPAPPQSASARKAAVPGATLASRVDSSSGPVSAARSARQSSHTLESQASVDAQ